MRFTDCRPKTTRAVPTAVRVSLNRNGTTRIDATAPASAHDARGWWSQGIEARLIFFDAGELAAVAQGKQESWTPQPYASLRIDRYLFEPGYDHPRQKRYSVGACCLDRERGVLYVAERCVQQDEERSVIHAFRIGAEHK